jgi:hypothetical protein
MVSPAGGQALVGFLQDSQLTLYELVSNKTRFFTAEEAQNHFANVLLASEARGSEDGLSLANFPEPAEVRDGEGLIKKRFWTGRQLVAALLPDGFEYESRKDGFKITGGQFVEIDQDGAVQAANSGWVVGSGWLEGDPDGLAAALYFFALYNK